MLIFFKFNYWSWIYHHSLMVLVKPTYLFTRLESLACSQQGFWQPSFCRKHYLWSLCCDGRNRVEFSALIAWRKGKVDTSPFFVLPSFSTQSPSYKKAMKRNTTRFPPNQNKGFINCTLCRKWAVRNPTETRLDYLVRKINKLVQLYNSRIS